MTPEEINEEINELWEVFHSLWGDFKDGKPYTQEIKDKFGKVQNKVGHVINENISLLETIRVARDRLRRIGQHIGHNL